MCSRVSVVVLLLPLRPVIVPAVRPAVVLLHTLVLPQVVLVLILKIGVVVRPVLLLPVIRVLQVVVLKM